MTFVTGMSNEPLLGFPIQPRISFSPARGEDGRDTLFPLTSTCACRLTLKIGPVPLSNEDMFAKYDEEFGTNVGGQI